MWFSFRVSVSVPNHASPLLDATLLQNRAPPTEGVGSVEAMPGSVRNVVPDRAQAADRGGEHMFGLRALHACAEVAVWAKLVRVAWKMASRDIDTRWAHVQ
ncbi:hypothetical protein FVE85_8673 [Porphyridium purpureum]|uniref:Uncharacterized protein n=1 Tax=Porphyridium purpureum TaxID=35688 RepID=A0A5J4YPJ2_PORPP|nr:hypothetical protein FVE85_8673 [Porphyridium purpureum]|eukprot:POR8023..scf296_7